MELRRLFLPMAGLLVAGGCTDDFATDPPPLPLAVREAYPTAGAVVSPEPPVAVSVTFTRPIAAVSEVRLRLIPAAESGRLELSASGRNVAWREVHPRAATTVQHLLVFAPTMRQPFTVYWRTDPGIEAGAVTGVIASADARYPPETAVVFAMGVESGFNTEDLRTFVLSEPSGVGVGETTHLGPNAYVTVRLPPYSGEYSMIAIIDTNGDLIYDPTEDWHGLHRDLDGTPLLIGALAGSFQIDIVAPGDP